MVGMLEWRDGCASLSVDDAPSHVLCVHFVGAQHNINDHFMFLNDGCDRCLVGRFANSVSLCARARTWMV